MKSILFFDFFSGNIAGAQKVTLNILEQLSDEFEISIFNRNEEGSLYGKKLRDKFKVYDIPFDRLISSVFGTGNFESSKKNIVTKILFVLNVIFFNLMSCYKVLKIKPDYIYTYDPRGLILSFLLLKNFKAKKIWHLHGTLNCSSFIAKIFIYFSDVIIVPSEAIKNSLPKSNKIIVIYNGFYFYESSKNKIDNDIIDLIFVGSLVPHKGLHNIIDALSSIEYNVNLNIYGCEPINSSYPFSYMQYLEEKSINIENVKINFIGWSENIPKYLSESDLLIFSSIINQDIIVDNKSYNVRSSEALPTVIIESLSVGTPVVATNTPGVNEIITDSNDGIIIDESKPKLILDSINYIIKNKKLYSPNVDKIRTKFSIVKMKDELLKIFNENYY